MFGVCGDGVVVDVDYFYLVGWMLDDVGCYVDDVFVGLV